MKKNCNITSGIRLLVHLPYLELRTRDTNFNTRTDRNPHLFKLSERDVIRIRLNQGKNKFILMHFINEHKRKNVDIFLFKSIIKKHTCKQFDFIKAIINNIFIINYIQVINRIKEFSSK